MKAICIKEINDTFIKLDRLKIYKFKVLEFNTNKLMHFCNNEYFYDLDEKIFNKHFIIIKK